MAVLLRISHGTPSVASVTRRNNLSFVEYVSPLRKLNPVMVDRVISVGGRLERSSKHHVTDLVIRDCHEREAYLGAGQVLASVRQKFWIVRGHTAVRSVIGKCLKCRFWNARPCEQIMAPLLSA